MSRRRAAGFGTPRSRQKPLGEAGAVGGGTPADDGKDTPVGKGDGGVHRSGAAEAQLQGEGHVGEGGREPVDDGNGIEALQERAEPLCRHGSAAEQRIDGDAFLACEDAESLGGEVVASRRPDQVGGVGDGRSEPLAFEGLDSVVDGARRPAGEGCSLQPVDEGRMREEPECFELGGFHPTCSRCCSGSPECGLECLGRLVRRCSRLRAFLLPPCGAGAGSAAALAFLIVRAISR